IMNMGTQLWILLSANTVLFTIAGFFLKQWVTKITSSIEKGHLDLNEHKRETDKRFSQLKDNISKRKGNTELLRKDFEKFNIHMSYQKDMFEELKETIKVKRKEEVEIL